MSEINLPEAKLVTRPDALRRLADRLSKETIIAVDTESNSLHAYREQVCLIQFSTPNRDVLVDPLALDDLSPLASIFSDAKIQKVFHAAEYDLICLKRDFDFSFENLFDTMIAARILGWEEIGLGSLLKEEFGVHLNKRFQQANWGRRPLPGDQLAYAQLDTHYLIPLRQRLKAELDAKGLWPLAREDFSRLRHVNGRGPGDVSHSCWRIGGSYDLNAQQAAVLQELCIYRDQVAKAINRPLFKVLNDRTLLAIAEHRPRNTEGLKRLPGMSEKQVQRHGAALLQAVQRGLRSDPLYPPRSPRPDERYLSRLEALRRWRKAAAQRMGVNSDIVLPRDLLFRVASEDPGGRKELEAILEEVPWRMERFGDQILALLARV